ncbi:hypothetical protein J6U78_03560 [bacterium]|nr:hypothetical protein [bacterium]
MKLRNITSIFVMMAVAGAAYAIPDSALIYMTGGGGSVKPAATNAVLEAAMAYTDLAISKAYELTEVHISTSPTNAFYPTADVVVLDSNTISFYLDNDFTLEGEAVFECYSPDDTPVYIASKTEQIADKVWSVLFTCGTIGQPIDFDLIVTVQPYNTEDKSARQVIFKLRRTF